MSDKDKGFASMDKEKVKEIASKGGQASHKNKDHDKDNNKDHDKGNRKKDSDKSDNNK